MPWYSKFYDSTGLVEVGGVNLLACSWFEAPPDTVEISTVVKFGNLDDLFKGRCKGLDRTD